MSDHIWWWAFTTLFGGQILTYTHVITQREGRKVALAAELMFVWVFSQERLYALVGLWSVLASLSVWLIFHSGDDDDDDIKKKRRRRKAAIKAKLRSFLPSPIRVPVPT